MLSDNTSRLHLIKKLFKWLLILALLVVVAYLAFLWVFFRQNPILMRFEPQDGLPKGYTWILQEGPDFDVYHANKLGDETSGIGIYLGNMPNYFYDAKDLPCESGRILSREISWVVMDGTEETVHPFFRETVLNYRHGVGFLYTEVHVWAYASQQDELDVILNNLQGLRLKPMATFLEVLAFRMGLLQFPSKEGRQLG
jgi:hypothetical protein